MSKRFVPLEQALFGIKDESLKGTVRAAYSDLLLNVHVDVDKNQPVLKRITVGTLHLSWVKWRNNFFFLSFFFPFPPFQMSYIWDELEESEGQKAAKVDTLSMCGESMPFFPGLRDWVVGCLEKEQSLIASKDQSGTHHFLISILKLVQSLVLFGYFTNTEDIIRVRFLFFLLISLHLFLFFFFHFLDFHNSNIQLCVFFFAGCA